MGIKFYDDWRLKGKCVGDTQVDPDFFHPEHPTPSHKKAIRQYCSDCPVRLECLSAGRYEHGFWGGQSSQSRKRKGTKTETALSELLMQMTGQSLDALLNPTDDQALGA